MNEYRGKPPYSMDDLAEDPQLERRYIKREGRLKVKERDLDRRNKRQAKRQGY